MAIVSKEQTVKLFDDEDAMFGEQSVSIDTTDNFMSISHNGNEINLRLENWLKLVELVNGLIKELK
jgi:hypothetical protein